MLDNGKNTIEISHNDYEISDKNFTEYHLISPISPVKKYYGKISENLFGSYILNIKNSIFLLLILS